MHLALQLPELLREVFSNLQEPYGSTLDWDALIVRPFLAVCARVCRKWHDLACYWLWRDMKNIDAFSRLLIQEDPNKGLNLTRFKHYSRWVQTMAYKLCDAPLHYTLQDAFVLNNAEPLFPNLKEFALYLDFEMDGLTVLNPTTFLHDGLECIVIDDCSNSAAAFQTFMECISQRSPRIVDFSVMISRSNIEPRRIALRQNIGIWSQLESLDLEGIWIDAAVFLAIATLPRLESYLSTHHDTVFAFCSSTEELGKIRKVQDCSSFFPAMREMSVNLTGDVCDAVINQYLGHLELRLLHISVPYLPTPEGGDACPVLFTPTPALSAHLKVIEIELGIAHFPDGHRAIDRFGKRQLEPLSACHGLRTLTVTHCCYLDMSGKELLQLMSNWPELEALGITCSTFYGIDQAEQLDLTLLPLLSEQCPNLAFIELPFCSRVPELSAYSKACPSTYERVQFESCFYDCIEDFKWIASIASYLAAVLPESCHLGLSHGGSEIWGGARRHHPGLGDNTWLHTIRLREQVLARIEAGVFAIRRAHLLEKGSES